MIVDRGGGGVASGCSAAIARSPGGRLDEVHRLPANSRRSHPDIVPNAIFSRVPAGVERGTRTPEGWRVAEGAIARLRRKIISFQILLKTVILSPVFNRLRL